MVMNFANLQLGPLKAPRCLACCNVVQEMPSTATEPVEAMKRARSGGASKTKRTLPPSGVIETIFPIPSTWP